MCMLRRLDVSVKAKAAKFHTDHRILQNIYEFMSRSHGYYFQVSITHVILGKQLTVYLSVFPIGTQSAKGRDHTVHLESVPQNRPLILSQ